MISLLNNTNIGFISVVWMGIRSLQSLYNWYWIYLWICDNVNILHPITLVTGACSGAPHAPRGGFRIFGIYIVLGLFISDVQRTSVYSKYPFSAEGRQIIDDTGWVISRGKWGLGSDEQAILLHSMGKVQGIS